MWVTNSVCAPPPRSEGSNRKGPVRRLKWETKVFVNQGCLRYSSQVHETYSFISSEWEGVFQAATQWSCNPKQLSTLSFYFIYFHIKFALRRRSIAYYSDVAGRKPKDCEAPLPSLSSLTSMFSPVPSLARCCCQAWAVLTPVRVHTSLALTAQRTFTAVHQLLRVTT